jgi:F-type H+-transporting ATPase subunit a
MDTTFLTGLRMLAADDHGGHSKAPTTMTLWGVAVYFAIVLFIIVGLMAIGKRGFSNRVFTNPVSWCFEQLYLFIQNLAVGIIGSHGSKYVPMVMVFWMVIFVGNVVGLFSPTTITADLSFNFGMALIAIGYVQYEGIRSNGFIGHMSHFAGPKMGLALIPINLMLFVIEVISETMRILSLSLRLYGNIDGGSKATDAMNALGHMSINGINFLFPMGAFLLPIKLLTCVVQALIFCLLFCVYLSLVTHHDHDEEHAHSGHPEPAHAH